MRITILALLILGCQNKVTNDATMVLLNYTDKRTTNTKNDTLNYTYLKANYKVIVQRHLANEVPHRIFGYLADNANHYGNYFKFDSDGILNGYYFMTGDGKHDSYRVIYNSDTKEYEEQGNAFVDYFAPNDVVDTGNIYVLIFSTFPRKSIDASYSTDNVNYKKLHLTERVPFIFDGDIVLTKKEVQQGIILKTKTKNLRTKLIGLDDGKETIDTLDFRH